MRYFIHLAYQGTAYSGWQRQPHSPSVQQTLEEALSLLLRTPLEVVGCGRTDAGVHASSYYAHLDYNGKWPEGFVRRLNKYLPADLVVYDLISVAAEAHARFDANYRAYHYCLSTRKDPFRTTTAYYFPFAEQVDPQQLQAAAALLLEYGDFAPFCKTGSDAHTMRCQLYRSEWILDEHDWVYHIAANRFLRGMVRLCVGMCLQVGTGKLTLGEVRHALDHQRLLPKSWSVPPNGLFLSEIRYPGIELTQQVIT